MENIQRKLAKVLAFILMLNTLFFNYTPAFTSSQKNISSRAKGDLKLSWQKNLSLGDNLETSTRANNSDEAFFSWDFSKDSSGTEVSTGTYELTYNIDDNKQIKFSVEKKSDYAEVTYSIKTPNTTSSGGSSSKASVTKTTATTNGYTNTVTDTDGYQVYKPDLGRYISPDSSTYPPSSGKFKIHYDETTNGGSATTNNVKKPKEVKFSITQGNGFAFKYKNNTIKFKWSLDGLFYFSTNGVKQGNIYDFNLSLKKDNNSTSITDEIKIFTGINTLSLKVTPKANDGKTEISQITRPITEYPGSNPKIEAEFDMPKVWDTSANKYDFEKTTATNGSGTNTVKPMSVVLNLGHTVTGKQIQIAIKDIYKDYTNPPNSKDTELEITNSSSSAKVTATRTKDNKVKIVIENIDSSTIYDPVTLATNRTGLEIIATNIELGKFYTYSKFSIVSLESGEFYIRIEPFKGYNGYYTVKSGDTSSTLSKWSVHEENNLGAEDILIPVNLSSENPQTKYFQVEFSLTPTSDSSISNTKKFTSQILTYKPDKTDVVLGTPTNLQILDSSVLYNPITKTNELIATLKWDMAYSNILEYLLTNNNNQPVDVIYNLNRGNSPETASNQNFLKLKANISKVNNKVTVKIEETGDKKYIDSSKVTESEVVVGNSTLKLISPTITFRVPVSSKTENKTQFVYPSVNFISINGEYTINNQKVTIPSSNSVNITIDEVLNLTVPQPQGVSTTDIKQNSFNITFSTTNWDNSNSLLYNYKTRFLEKIGLTLSTQSVKYSFYISQSKEALDKLINNKDTQNLIKTYDYNLNSISSGFDFSKTSIDNKVSRDLLREGNIIEIKNVLQTDLNSEKQVFSLNGLDNNQAYYLVIKTHVTPYEKENLVKKDEYTEDSTFSSLVTATTLTSTGEPSESEKSPSAPSSFTKENVTLTSTNLIWSEVQNTGSSTLEYQFIRTKESLLGKEFLENNVSYEDVWKNLNSSSKFGFRTSGDKLETYSGTSFTTAPSSSLEYVTITGSKRNILDKTLSPNEIYFYYVRTVRVVNNKDVAYSVWVPLSVTSSNISAPKDLTILKGKAEKPTTQITISFKTPAMDLEEFKKNYKPQYEIRKDTGSWSKGYYIDLNNATLVKNDDGTITVTYTITGLTHASLYSIRVRLYNTKLNVYSDYSNEASGRTDTDKDQSKNDAIIDEWKENYKSLLEEYINQDYWFITNSLSKTSVLYRPDHIGNLINSSSSSIIELESGLGGAKREYYIPASEMEKVVNSNKGFKTTFGNTEVTLSSASLKFINNSALNSILKAIKDGYAKDYFVKISITFNEGNYTIDGQSSISPSVDVSLQFVGTSKSISSWDSSMIETLKTLLNERIDKDLKNTISELISSNAKNEEILSAINKELNSLKSTFGTKLSSQINSITKRTYSADVLNGNIIISQSVGSQTNVTGYTLESYVWKSVTTSTYGNKKAIYTNKLGTYIFAGSSLIISGIENIENGSLITQIINKYSLQDYLGKNGINLNANLTRNAAIGTAARVAGASNLQDANAFFVSKGVTLSTRNLDSNITTQEAIYLLMKAYEYRTNTKIETVKISNYNLTSGITGLNNSYKKPIQVAFQTGIYTNQNMIPNGNITVKEFLQSLANLINKVGL